MRRPLLLLASAVLCTCSSPTPGSLKVQVNLAPGISSRCARLIARGNNQRDSSAVVLAGRSSFVVGISQDDEKADVLLQARGFSDEGCTTLTVPPENSELVAARFSAPTPIVMLTLRTPQGTGVDADGDTFFAGPDCNDDEALINPGTSESCTNGIDDDCDGAIDCIDPDCAARACGVSGQCTNGACRAPSETGLCGDGLDNDGDGDIDCADGDCPLGVACNDANACTRGEVCAAAGCVGVAVTCDHPPSGQCVAGAGTCLPDAGCSYPVMTGACNDGRACTQNDICRSDGTCAGTPRTCDSPPGPCSASTGTCSESQGGACVYATRTGSCDDGENCTRDDACDAAGHCSGTRVSCTAPNECFTASGCSSSGGCLFSVRSGSCSGGMCNSAGACVASTPDFPFTPTNFTSAQLPTSAGSVVVNCDVTIDTSTGAWSTCPGGVAAPAWSLAGPSMLIFFEDLTISAGVTVRAVGDRPLIIAVRDEARIEGELSASSDGSQGAGSELSCGGGVGENGRTTSGTAGGGGGGGFGNRGGNGSDGDHGGKKGDRGNENGNDNLTPLRGGCSGGDGGGANQGSGAGGRGGGAIQLSAGAITLGFGSTVSAQGEGGSGAFGNNRIGGGGGGSGGAIFLEANDLTISAGSAVVANGGAGGEGAGADGQGGQRSFLRALPISQTCGGDGGNGGARLSGAGDGHRPNCSDDFPGGGGGGSTGRIRFNARNNCSMSDAAMISPQANAGRCH